jgi:hypothetical protein
MAEDNGVEPQARRLSSLSKRDPDRPGLSTMAEE